MLKKFKERLAAYTPEAALKMRQRMMKSLRSGIIWFGVLGSFTAYLTWKIASGESNGAHVAFASLATGVLLFSLLVAYERMKDFFVTPPNLHPYFSAKLPGCALDLGAEMLKQSRALDSLAAAAGLKRIGEFVSDDDFFDGPGPTWHLAEEGVATFEMLLKQANLQPCVKAAESDLKSILDFLLLARANGTQFCLLFREIHVTNHMEWEQRKGFC
ncbi:hypothetical protein [Prosthecobacter sp.]|uniref:hypothetical protein n=1 Tax=Prosthecobacter sp. TaxID=1965333 RepID=UPI00378390C5